MTAQENGQEQSNANRSLDTVPDPGLGDDRELARFLVGLLLLGKDELSQGLEGAEPLEAEPRHEEGASSDQLRHLTLGLLARGQRRAGKALRAAYHLSTGTASWTLDVLDRWTDTWLMRPLRHPIERRIRYWQEETAEVIEEGKREERDSRALAAERVETLIEYLFDRLAESQELDRLILELVGQKSTTYATQLVDNLRALTATLDYALEDALRKLLRRTPRRALPPSPLRGQPQTMYDSENLVRRVIDHVG
jgi:hypothetical protein